MKVCIKCSQEKDEAAFSKNKKVLDGYQTYCKMCVHKYHVEYNQRPAVKARHNARTKKFYSENKTRYRMYARKSELKSLYNITPEVYDEMLSKQNDKCRICSRHKSEFTYKLCVDHHHTTNQVRGLLCKPCNLIIGNAKDSSQILSNAIRYLQTN